jgi:hypothetical protein
MVRKDGGKSVSGNRSLITCPPPLFNFQEAQCAGGLVGTFGEDSSVASS